MLDTYFDEALRPMEDLDLFIHERDIGRVVTIFEKAGYDVNAAMRDIWKPNRNHAYVLFNSDTADVDLHHMLCPWYEEKYIYKINSRKFFNESSPKTINGVKINFLRKEDEFYSLLINIMRNDYRNPFRYYIDIDSIARVHGKHLDYDRLIKNFSSSGVKKNIAGMLDFMVRKLKTPLPADIAAELNGKIAHVSFTASTAEERLHTAPMTKHKGLLHVLTMAGTIFDMLHLALIYLRWQLFKRFGLFGNFFRMASKSNITVES